MQDHPTAAVVTETAACTTSRHGLCKGVVFTLTGGLDAPLQPCGCACHRQAAELPETFAEVVTLYPPCDRDGAA